MIFYSSKNSPTLALFRRKKKEKEKRKKGKKKKVREKIKRKEKKEKRPERVGLNDYLVTSIQVHPGW